MLVVKIQKFSRLGLWPRRSLKPPPPSPKGRPKDGPFFRLSLIRGLHVVQNEGPSKAAFCEDRTQIRDIVFFTILIACKDRSSFSTIRRSSKPIPGFGEAKVTSCGKRVKSLIFFYGAILFCHHKDCSQDGQLWAQTKGARGLPSMRFYNRISQWKRHRQRLAR